MKTINKIIKKLLQENDININPKLIKKGSMQGYFRLISKKERYTDQLKDQLHDLGFYDILGNKDDDRGFCKFARNHFVESLSLI